MDPKRFFSLLHAICNNDSSLVIKLCKGELSSSVFLNPLSLALRINPVNPEIVQTLLEHGFAPSPEDFVSLKKLALTELIPSSLGTRPQSQDLLLSEVEFLTLWEIANKSGDANLSQYFLSIYAALSSSQQKNLLKGAVEKDHLNIMTMLLECEQTHSIIRCNELILIAASLGHLEIIKKLLEDPRSSPAANNNEAIRLAAQRGHLDVVELLLQHPHVNPSTNSNEAIRLASQCGYLDIVKRLLKDQRVLSTVDSFKMAEIAIKHREDINLLSILLETKTIDLRHTPERFFSLAWEKRNPEIMTLLLAFTPIETQPKFLKETHQRFPYLSASLTQEVNWLHSLFSTGSNPLRHKAFKILEAETGVTLDAKTYVRCAKHLYSSSNQQQFFEYLTTIGPKIHIFKSLNRNLLNIAKTFYPLLAASKTILDDKQAHPEIPIILPLIAHSLYPEVSAPLAVKFLKNLQQHLLPSPQRSNAKMAFDNFIKIQAIESFDRMVSNLYQSKTLSNHWVETIKSSSASRDSLSL